MAASSITIVTKDTAQTYTGGTTAAAKGTVLTVLEVDSNFINLKEGIVVLENTVSANYNHFTSEINTLDTDLRTYVNNNFIAGHNANLTGTPRAPTPGGSSASQIQTVDGVNALISPISSLVNSPSTGNNALLSFLNLKANLNSPSLTGFPRLTGSSYNFSTWDGVTQYLAPVEYVQDKLENLSGDVKPTSAGGADLGTATEHFNELHVNAILPAGSNATIGTPTNRFPFGYFDTGDFGPNTILVGDAEISADGSTLVVPVNTAIGDQDNVLPLNIASTVVDKRFGELSLTQALDQTFTASGAITARDAVAINADGTVSTISSTVSNLNYVGIALSSAADAGTLSVRVHGEVSGFTGLTDGGTVFVENDGSLVQTKTTTALKIGTAISATEILFFTTSNLDTYLLNIKKTELGDFSASNASTASGSGGISYNSATGQFTFTPADTTSFATTSYVDTEIASLVNSAPTSLDTLDELAAALNDDANFASTVTNSIATKAPLASPALTGTPTAPTASSGTNTTQIATTAYVQSELSGLGNASLNSFSVSTGSASGGGSLAYNNTNGVFTFAPADLSNVLTSYTETDPVVGAINGIVKADGNGNISAAVAGTDYSTFDGAFTSLTNTPTTVSGYGITDAAPLASPTFTGTPSGPTATSGTNTTQLATTAFVQSAVSGSSGIALTDLSVTTNTANAGGALSYNDATGVFTFVPADQAFSALTGTPTTISGYGITDAAPLASPTFTGTPAAPTAASGTNTTQLATTAFVQGEISGFSSTGGDSQADFTASGAITQGKAVILSSTAGQVEEVSQAAVAGAHATAVSNSSSAVYRTQAVPLDYNDQDSVYQQFWYDGSNLVGSVWSTNLGTLTFSPGTGQSLTGGVTPDNYFHIKGTSTGILRAGTNSYIVTNSSGTLSIGSANAVGAYTKIVTTENGDLIALNGSDCYFVTVSGTTISFGSAIAIGLTPDYEAFEWSPTYDKLVAATISSGTITYTTGTVSGSNITWASVSTESSWGSTSTNIAFHVGVERLVGFRRHFQGSGVPTTVKFRSSSFNGSVFAFSSSTETTLLGPSSTNPSAAYFYLSPYIKCSKTDGGFGIFTKYEYNSTDRYLGNLTSGGVFSLPVAGSRVVTRESNTTANFYAGGENDPAGYLSMGVSSGQTYPSNNSSAHSVFFRTTAASTKSSYLGIAQSTVSSGSTVTVMLAGAVSDVHSSLTPDTKMYVQNDGTITSTVSTVVAGTAINATSIQVADGRGTFDKAVSFTTLSDKPTTIAGYGITDAATTTYVDTEINNLVLGDSQKSYTSSSAITQGDAVVLDSAGTVSSVVVSSPGAGGATALDTALYATTTTSYDDYNNLYYFFFVASGEIRAEIITPDFANLTTTNGTAQVLVQSVTTADKFKYIHLPGTSTGIIVYNTASGYQARLISQSGGTFTVNSPVSLSNSGDTIRDITLGPSNTPLLLIEDYNAAVQVAAITVSGTTLSIGTYDQITGFTNIPADIFYAQNKIVVADPVGTTLEYAVGTISGTTVSMNAATSVSVTNTYADIYYHGGSGYFVLTRSVQIYSPRQGELHLQTLAFNGTTLTAGIDVQTGWFASRDIQPNYQEWQFSSSGTGIAAYAFWENYSNQYIYYGFGTINSSGTFTKSTNLASLATAENGKYTNPGAVQNKDGYGLFITRDYSTAVGGTGQYTRATLVRLDSVSNSDSWLGIAESTVSSGASVNVILAGGVADVYTGLTPNTDYYVQDDGTVATTSSNVFAGVAVASTALQVADSKNTFRKTIQFADLANKPTTLSGYGISGDIDIGSSDFITTGKSYFANMFATTGDLPSATTYHGMFAHVHGTGAGYFAHAGNWVELANKSYVDTEVANLVNSAPATLDTLDELAAALNDDANFAATVTTSLGLKAPLASPALTGTPTAPTASSGTNTTQIATTAFVAAAVSGLGGGGGASVTTSDAAPSSPSAGDLWYNTDAGGLFLYYTDADSSQWVEVVGKTGPTGATGAAGGSTITVSDAAPSSPVAGQLWWNSTSNKLYIYYTDANSSQWVQATTPGATGATGATGALPGRNKFINGNFDVWQRGTSRTTSGHLADRWRTGVVGNSQCTFSQQSFTLGQTDVPFNPKYYQRAVVTAGSDANSYVLFNQRIEDVRTFQGETVTVSFWAKADATKDFVLEPYQYFGSTGTGGSAAVPITPQTVTLSTTWTKYTKTFSIPSITGKTLGTDENNFLGFFFWLDAGSDWNSRAGSLGNQSGTFDFAQIQVERGSTATDFETEYYSETLRKCQRYYYEYPKGETYSFIGTGFSASSTKAHIFLQYPVPMRAVPTQTSTGNFQIIDGGSRTVTAFQLIDATSFNARLDCTASGQTQGRGCMLRNNNDANATIMLEAEL